MKYHFIAAFLMVSALVLVSVAASCSLSASSEALNVNETTASRAPYEEGFMPVAADENAAGDATDVLITSANASVAPALADGKWINSEPLTLEALRGRVVYVEFWTFGCYNCINTLPTVRGFDAKYRDKGLTVIGVQSPEFDREKPIENITAAVKKLEIKYPVVTDNEMKTWNAYGVNAWPTIVILDKTGRIRYRHIGEGEYETQEKVIKTLLAEGQSGENASSDEVFDGKTIVRTEQEWAKLLTPAEFHILREEGTDSPYRSQYNDNHENGDYYCAACHLKLFSSKTKFESGTGWPSFYQPIIAKNVVEKTDRTLGVSRTEIECARCGGHLGHVFDDGPKPTGLRYCMNGTALKFEKK